MPEAFYLPDGERFTSTELTRGPWDPGHQHAGPPAALLARALERCEPRESTRITRITVEILRAVPIEPVSVSAQIVQPDGTGLADATLHDEPGSIGRALQTLLVSPR